MMDKHQWFGAFQRASMRCVEAEKLLAEIVDYVATDPCYDLNRDAMVDRVRRFLGRTINPYVCPGCLEQHEKVLRSDGVRVCKVCGEPQP